MTLHEKYTTQQQSLYSLLSGTTRVTGTRRNIHPPTNLYQLLPSTNWSIASSILIMCLVIFLHNLSPRPFGLTLGLETSTSNSIHFFTQSVSSFRNTCPYYTVSQKRVPLFIICPTDICQVSWKISAKINTMQNITFYFLFVYCP